MHRRLALLLALAGAAGSPAAAQNALGDGRALEYRQGVTASHDRAGASQRFMSEIRFRNAIVTGNAPAGMSFRGDVGYRAPGEFTGDLGVPAGTGADLGSNDLFPFRRDSYYSGLSGYGLRGTDALQYQFSLTTGADAPRGLVGTPAINRAGIGRVGGDVYSERPGSPLEGSQLVQIDPQELDRREDLEAEAGGRLRGTLMNSLRSPSAYTTTRQLQPTLLQESEDEQGRRFGLIASPLQGIRVTPLGDEGEGEDEGDRMDRLSGRLDGRLDGRVDRESGTPGQLEGGTPGERDRSGALSRGLDQRAGDSAGPQAVSRRVVTSHDRLMDTLYRDFQERSERLREAERMDAEGEGEAGAMDSLESRLAQMREELRRLREGPQIPEPGEGEPTEADPRTPAEQQSPLEQRSPQERERQVDESIYDLIRGAGGEVDSLMLPAEPGYDPFSEYMRAAEQMLAEGRYFDAEDRFARALAARPRDVSAQIGRLHAQLGAGMLLSAATNLRAVLMGHPEAAGMRYEGDLLPHEERQEQLISQLRSNMRQEGEAANGRSLERESALLLAYLGYQRQEPRLVREGLEALGESESRADEALRSLLEGVWLGQDGEGG